MAGLSLQRKLAARILKIGKTRIWFDPEHMPEVKNAITAMDIRKMISHGYIKRTKEKLKYPTKIGSTKRTPGRTKGKSGAIYNKKRRWINTVRSLRVMIKELKTTGKINQEIYKKTYMLIKGGSFRSRAHLKLHLEQKGVKL